MLDRSCDCVAVEPDRQQVARNLDESQHSSADRPLSRPRPLLLRPLLPLLPAVVPGAAWRGAGRGAGGGHGGAAGAGHGVPEQEHAAGGAHHRGVGPPRGRLRVRHPPGRHAHEGGWAERGVAGWVLLCSRVLVLCTARLGGHLLLLAPCWVSRLPCPPARFHPPPPHRSCPSPPAAPAPPTSTASATSCGGCAGSGATLEGLLRCSRHGIVLLLQPPDPPPPASFRTLRSPT